MGRARGTCLLDTGASSNFISASFAKQAGVYISKTADTWPQQVTTGTGLKSAVLGSVSTRISIGSLKCTVQFSVIDLAQPFDVILGYPWLSESELQLGKRRLVLKHSGRSVSIRLAPRLGQPGKQGGGSDTDAGGGNSARGRGPPGGTLMPMLSALQLQKAMRQGAIEEAFLVMVNEVNEIEGMDVATGHLPADHPVRDLLAEYADVLREPTTLPPDRPVSHVIPLEPGARPPHRGMYRLTPLERAEVHKQVQELLAKGFIRPSVSPFSSPVIFVRKKDGTLRMCIDYIAVNKLTVKNRYPLPRIDQLLDTLQGSTVFSSLDLHSGYHQVKLRAEDVPKTAFSTPGGHYEWLVLSFGLANAPSTFMSVMNDIFRDLLDKFVLIYIDDILVYSKSPEEHLQHLKIVMQRLRDHNLLVKLKKCEFFKDNLKFLGHLVGKDGIQVDPDKVKVVSAWPEPQTPGEVRSFLGLANYFRKFIQGFSSLARPLSQLANKPVMDGLSDKERASFRGIQQALVEAPVLVMPDMQKDFVIICDASKYGMGAVLMQDDHPVAFMSKALSAAEKNYPTTEQELLAVVKALREWRCYLLDKPFIVHTDHNPNVFFNSKPDLSARQVRWAQELAQFNFSWVYKPGRVNVADPLSRCVNLLQPEVLAVTTRAAAAAAAGQLAGVSTAIAAGQLGGAGTTAAGQLGGVSTAAARQLGGISTAAAEQLAGAGTSAAGQLGGTGTAAAGQLGAAGTAAEIAAVHCSTHRASRRTTTSILSPLEEAISKAYTKDRSLLSSKKTSSYVFKQGLWMFKDRVVVPAVDTLRQQIIHAHHDTPYSGHFGVTKTDVSVKKRYYWPGMGADIKQYVASCLSCQLNKPKQLKPAGLLQPLCIPHRPWGSISTDFITGLPKTANGNEQLCVWVDRLTKMAHFIPAPGNATAADVAVLFRDHIFRLHGLPDEIVSDRDPKFTGAFWTELTQLLGIGRAMSSAHHAATDGQTERVNRFLEEMLRHYVNPRMDDWDQHLSMLEFAYNNAHHESINTSPFQMYSGIAPLTPNSTVVERTYKVPAAHEFQAAMRQALDTAKQCLQKARARIKHYADLKRRDAEFAVGDQVLLNTQHLRLKGMHVRKLTPRFVGPFKVIERLGPVAYRLDLPACMKCHNVFHVSLLAAFRSDGRYQPPPPPVEVDGELEYTVECILDHKKWGRNQRRFLVRWLGYGPESDSWEPESYLCDVDALHEYKLANAL